MSASAESLQGVFDRAFAAIGQMREAFVPHLTLEEVGTVTSVATGIAKVSGLPSVGFDELVTFPGGVFGIAFNVDEDELGVVLLGDYQHLRAGDEVQRAGRVMDVGVGEELLGRVIDPLGRPLDAGGPVASNARLPIERPATPIMDRAPVAVPLQTGLKAIDALIPIGRGQRELILGDRQTGKTSIAMDAILNQRGENVVCVYCAIGQRASAVAKAVANLREKGAMEYTVVVVTEGNDPAGLAYIAPYAATSIAEHFMEAGRDVLIVYDDLTQHARAYRELSLLLRRPPGAKRFRATSSTSTRVCWSAPPGCMRTLAAARLPRCRSSRPRRRTCLPTSRPTSSPSRTDRSTSRRRSSSWACFPRSTLPNPYRASVGRRSAPPTVRWRAT
jgi:F-type H+-transporting ATPase subunit alpha